MRLTTLLAFAFLTVTSFVLIPADASGQLVISEFRVRGPNGANDEFIEIQNNTPSTHIVAGGGTGYAVAASNGVARCVIPNGTAIPARGHYLCTNSVGYSLASYPAGNGTTATGDATYTTDIPDNAGIAIFNTSVAANFILANRMDAVGSTSEANTLYKEGTGYPALVAFSINYAFVRDMCGKGGSITTFSRCIIDGPKDTNNNAADFVFVDTNGTSAGAGQRLGAPGPENLSSPLPSRFNLASPTIRLGPLDPCVSNWSPPNAVRDFTSDPPNNSTFGTVDLRMRLTNFTGSSLTRARLRIVDLTTFPAPSGISDLRPRTSTSVVVTVDGAPCGSGTSNITVNGTTLEQPPSQPNGGGFNSSMSIGTITLATPVPNGGSVPFRVLLGIQQTGSFKFGVVVETLSGGSVAYYIQGQNSGLGPFTLTTPFDFTGDGETDISIYRPTSGQWWFRSSSSGVSTAATFGLSTDITVPADFTGDDVVDRAFYRPSNGSWFILRSGSGTFYSAPFGVSTDVPAPGDYDGDGMADLAVFRPSNGTWYINYTGGGPDAAFGWGQSGDLPVPADFDGDGVTDLAIWRPSVGQWWILYSQGGHVAYSFGTSTDKAVVGDYTGDARADIAFWRPSTGQWFILRSTDQSYYVGPFGANGDLPVPGDYDGDDRIDTAVFRPSNATWYIDYTGPDPITIMNYGLVTDKPVPNSFVR